MSEVVREGLRLLKERERLVEARLQSLWGEIQLGFDQSDRGEFLDGDAVMDDLRASLRKKR